MRTAEFRLCFFKQEEVGEEEEEQAVAPYRSCSLRCVVVVAEVVEYRISHIPDIANAFIADSQRQLADKIATADNKRGRARGRHGGGQQIKCPRQSKGRR